MTPREKAKQTFDEIDFLTWQIDIINDCIDKIYDDFEDELQNAYKQGIKDEARCHQPKDNQ